MSLRTVSRAALATDDWRDRANDRSLERESLGQVLRDLEIDTADIAPMLHQTRWLAEATGWINDRIAEGHVPHDSLVAVIDSMGRSSVYTYEFSNFAYSGLKSTGRIDLIEDGSLKEALVYYFEDRQKALAAMNAVWWETNRTWFKEAGPHIRWGAETASTVDGSYPPVHDVDLTSLIGDAEFRFANADHLAWNHDFRGFVEELLELNSDLHHQIRAYLGSD